MIRLAGPAEHDAFLEDLKRRRTCAAVLLGELKGRRDVDIAVRQGQAEEWASEYLSQMRQEDSEARKTLIGSATVVRNPILARDLRAY